MRGVTVTIAIVLSASGLVRLQSEEPVFEPAGELQLVSDHGAGEGPAWHPELGLLASFGSIHRHVLVDKPEVFFKDAGTNGLLFDRQGRLLACQPVHRRVIRRELDGSITVLTDSYEGAAYNQPNDLTVDSQGRIYFSDPKYGPRENMDLKDDKGRTVEGVYRIDLDGSVTRIITHAADRPNGLLVSLDDRFLFVADNNNNTVGGSRFLYRFRLRSDGSLAAGSRRLLYDWKSGRGPDGLVQDRLGRLYVAAGRNKPVPPYETADRFKAGVYVFSPRGVLIDFVAVPNDEVTNCTFGDDDLRSLYITAGGHLYRIRTTTPGWLPWPASR